MKAWISAFRLRTLPLAISSILLGSFLAAADGVFQWNVFLLSIITAILLQILSNLANDYGDSVKGTDNEERIGPQRAVQSGAISAATMKKAVIGAAALSAISGSALLYFATSGLGVKQIFIFILLGVACIFAAIKYTVGKKAYGYLGMGDVFVFVFFGWVAVLGAYFLQTHQMKIELLLPASALGLLCVGVLNLNNMRDRKNDQKSGKMTIAVKLGERNSKIYHSLILLTAMILPIIYTLINFNRAHQFIFVITAPLIIQNLLTVLKNKEPKLLDPLLKRLALTTSLFVVSFGIGLIL